MSTRRSEATVVVITPKMKMKMKLMAVARSFVSLAVLTVVIGFVRQAEAAPITFELTGEVTKQLGDLSPFGENLVGEIITGSYTFDSEATDAVLNEQVGVYASTGAPFGVHLAIGGNAFDSEGVKIKVLDRAPEDFLSADVYAVSAVLGSGFQEFAMAFELVDSTATAFTSDELPLTPPEVDDFVFNSFQLAFGSEAGGNYVEGAIIGKITSLSGTAAVPEPGTLLLIGSGLVGTGVGARKRRK